MKPNWEELRCLVAVVETGSLTAASKVLEISQPTVGRRIKDLQQCLGADLLRRDQDHYEATEFGRVIYALARQMRDTAWAIESKARQDTTQLSGKITLATTECLAVTWLSRQLSDVITMFPKIDLEVVTGAGLLNIIKREADIAIRIGSRGPEEELIGEKVASVNFGLYCSRTYLDNHGRPESFKDLTDHNLIESIGRISEVSQAATLRGIARDSPVPVGSDNILAQANAATHGLGIVSLPYYLAYSQPGITRVLEHEFDIDLDLWLLIHRDLIQIPAFKAVYNHLNNCLKRDAGLFDGTVPMLSD